MEGHQRRRGELEYQLSKIADFGGELGSWFRGLSRVYSTRTPPSFPAIIDCRLSCA